MESKREKGIEGGKGGCDPTSIWNFAARIKIHKFIGCLHPAPGG